MVRMAYLGVIASHTVNGVAAIHSEIIRETVFKDFAELWPNKFTNVTNGVTQRRWLAFSNPALRQLLTKRLGSDAWIKCDQSLECSWLLFSLVGDVPRRHYAGGLPPAPSSLQPRTGRRKCLFVLSSLSRRTTKPSMRTR